MGTWALAEATVCEFVSQWFCFSFFNHTMFLCLSAFLSRTHSLLLCTKGRESETMWLRRDYDYGIWFALVRFLSQVSLSDRHALFVSPFWMRKQWNTEEVWWDTHRVIMSVAHQRHLCLFKIFYTLPVDITRQKGKEENQLHLNNTPGTHPEYIFGQDALIDLVLQCIFFYIKNVHSKYGTLQNKDTLDYHFTDNVLEIYYFWNSAVYKHIVLKKAILFQAGWVPHKADKNKCGPHLTIYSLSTRQAQLMYSLNRN